MKILLATYSAGSHTSYGRVTREIWTRLRAQNPDWQIMQHGWFHHNHQQVNWHIEPTATMRLPNGKVTPNQDDRHGRLSFRDVLKGFRPDVVWTLSDPFMCDYMGQYKPEFGFKLIKHCPVDGAPQPLSWRDAMKDCDLFVPVTEYGSRVLEPIFGKKLTHIYHGVDTDLYVPVPKDDPKRLEDRRNMGCTPDTFLFGFVGHNQWRKQNWNMFPLLKYLRDGKHFKCKHCGNTTLTPWDEINRRWGLEPGSCRHCGQEFDIHSVPCNLDVRLWFHGFNRKQNIAWPTDQMQYQWRLDDALIYTKGMGDAQGVPDAEMPAIYQALDGYLCLSGGEGFCLPVLEAMACGVPNLYVNYSGHVEVAKHAGIPVRYSNLVPEYGEIVHRAIVDMEDLVGVAYQFVRDHQARERLGRSGVNAARDVFSLDLVAQQWGQLIRSACSARKHRTVGVSV